MRCYWTQRWKSKKPQFKYRTQKVSSLPLFCFISIANFGSPYNPHIFQTCFPFHFLSAPQTSFTDLALMRAESELGGRWGERFKVQKSTHPVKKRGENGGKQKVITRFPIRIISDGAALKTNKQLSWIYIFPWHYQCSSLPPLVPLSHWIYTAQTKSEFNTPQGEIASLFDMFVLLSLKNWHIPIKLIPATTDLRR